MEGMDRHRPGGDGRYDMHAWTQLSSVVYNSCHRTDCSELIALKFLFHPMFLAVVLYLKSDLGTQRNLSLADADSGRQGIHDDCSWRRSLHAKVRPTIGSRKKFEGLPSTPLFV